MIAWGTAYAANAQYGDRLIKRLHCTNTYISQQLDLLVSTRAFGEYEPVAVWSSALGSNDFLVGTYELESDVMYVILVCTEPHIDALGLEIRDERGVLLEYIPKITDLDRNILNHFFVPMYNGRYHFQVRVQNRNKPRTCSYLMLLQGEEDFR